MAKKYKGSAAKSHSQVMDELDLAFADLVNPKDSPIDPEPPKAPHKPVEKPRASADLALSIVSPSALAKKTFQRKVLAQYAPKILIKTMESLMKALDDHDDSKAREQAFQAYEILSGNKGNGVSVFVSQKNNNVGAVSQPGPADDGQFATFEDIARIVDGERRKKLAAPALDVTFIATPED